MYLDMARMYEYLPTDGTSMPNDAGNDVTNLTVPIVTEKTTEEESYNNPRVTREKWQNLFSLICKQPKKTLFILPKVLVRCPIWMPCMV